MKLWHRNKLRRKGTPDYFIVACIAFLVLFGLTMLASASSNLGKMKYNDTYYFLEHQFLFGFLPGLAFFLIAANMYYGRYQKIALWLLLIGVILLAAVFTPLGVHAKGATRWLALGPITFQPSEVVKPLILIYLASWLARRRHQQKSLGQGLVPFFLMLGTVTALLLAQPATSTVAILIVTASIIYFVGGARMIHIAGFAAAMALIFMGVIYLTPYRLERIQTFFSPSQDTQSSGYHINQALIAIGSGGLTGVGYGQSTTKIRYLPEPAGDSIFAVIAEELGFIGGVGLVALFFALVFRILMLARRTHDKFAELLLIGFGSLIAIQAFMNIAAISGLIPLTGTPLPFISYGGTALAVFMGIGGIIVNISKYV
jgi:cell division protein FtsW